MILALGEDENRLVNPHIPNHTVYMLQPTCVAVELHLQCTKLLSCQEKR